MRRGIEGLGVSNSNEERRLGELSKTVGKKIIPRK